MPAAAEAGILERSFEMNGQEMPTDAASFLPLVLQAQDLVAKLESRVVELENDLETINEAHEQEREQLLQEIGEKDEYIHNLKTRVSRLEFGAREAIVVLARTVETLKAQNIEEEDDNSSKDDDDATAVESTDLEGQFLDSIKLCLNYLKTPQSNTKTHSSGKRHKRQSKPARRDSKMLPSNDEITNPDGNDENKDQQANANTDPLPPLITARRDSKMQPSNDEETDQVHPLSNDKDEDKLSPPKRNRGESFSSGQISLDDIGLDEYEIDGSEDIADFVLSDDEDANEFASQFKPKQQLNEERTESESKDAADSVNRQEDNIDSNLREETHNASNNNNNEYDEGCDSEEEMCNSEDDERTADEEGEDEEEEEEEEEDDDDDDDENDPNALPQPGPIQSLSHQTQSLCPNCDSLLAQVDQHIEERAYLKRDLSALAISLSEEQQLRAQILENKASLEQEIDDWINAMFEKVNQMVFDEANSREELEILNRETSGKLIPALKASGSREDRLREMKLLLVHLDSTKQRQSAPAVQPTSGILSRSSSIRRSVMSNSPSPRASRNFGNMSPSLFSASSMEEFMYAKGKKVYIDGIVYEEFQEYVKSFAASPQTNNFNPNSPFMKRCMAEDIQPCLFEGKSGWKSPFYKRRLLDAIMKSQCEIQTIFFGSSMPSTPTTSQVSLSSQRSNYQEPPPAPKVKCGLCGNVRSCEFRMRLSGSDAAVPPSTTTLNSPSSLSITEKPGWIPLDRFCRDRVVAVCDFYAYLSHLRQGLLASSPVWGMYKQCLKHRRKMGMARVGSVSMFEQDDNSQLDDSEMEGMVVIVH